MAITSSPGVGPASPQTVPALIGEGDRILAMIEHASRNPALIPALSQLMDLRERWRKEKAEEAFNAAKARILEKLSRTKIVKNRSVLYEIEKGKPDKGMYEAFRYAPLEEIDRILRPMQADEQMDLSYTDEPGSDGRVMVRGRLKHLPLGHYEDSFMSAPLDITGGKNNVQAIGSTNSYLRRYIACNLYNIVVVGDDDDGTGGLVTAEQCAEILEKIHSAGVGQKFLTYVKAKPIEETGSLEASVETILAVNYRRAISALDERIAQKAKA